MKQQQLTYLAVAGSCGEEAGAERDVCHEFIPEGGEVLGCKMFGSSSLSAEIQGQKGSLLVVDGIMAWQHSLRSSCSMKGRVSQNILTLSLRSVVKYRIFPTALKWCLHLACNYIVQTPVIPVVLFCTVYLLCYDTCTATSTGSFSGHGLYKLLGISDCLEISVSTTKTPWPALPRLPATYCLGCW